MTELTSTSFDSPAAYASALAEFLSNDPLAEPYIGYRAPSLENSAQHLAGRQALLFDAGWSRLGWPQTAGGLGEFHRYLRRVYVLDGLFGNWRMLEHEIGARLQSTGVVPHIGSL